MFNKKFIMDILNIDVEKIQDLITTSQADNSIKVKLKLVPLKMLCPNCKRVMKIHGYYERKLKHSSLLNRKCHIVFQQRRYICDNCGITFSEKNPFIDSREHITYETKLNVLKDLKYIDSTFKSAAMRNNISTSKAIRIFDKHVDIPRKTLPLVLSIDEHYLPNSDYGSKYCCLLMDFLSGEIIDILPDRKKDYLVRYFGTIRQNSSKNTISELDNVKYISIDMYDPYRDLASIFFPKAKVCADSFHVLKHLTDDFRKIRIRCYRNTEDGTIKYLLLKFKHVFDHNKYLDNEPQYNKRLACYINYREIREILFKRFPELKAAYELKEYYINLNANKTFEEAPVAIKEAIGYFEKCGIQEYDEFYSLLTNWYEEIVNSFIKINGRRINNSYMESKNRLVSRLIYNSNGIRNFKRTRNRLLYCLNPDDTFKL